MHFITKIEPLGRRKLEAALELDGAAWAVLDMETLVRERLALGEGLTAQRVAAVLATDAFVRARKAAASYTSQTARTRRELEQHLRQKGYSAVAIEAALEALERSGTLDEVRAAQGHVRKRRRGQYGPRRIEAELRARGVGTELTRASVRGAVEGVDLKAECMELARKQAARVGDLADAKQRKRLMDWLLRRGYEGEAVSEAVRVLARERGEVRLDADEAD
jgi:regulatory protein